MRSILFALALTACTSSYDAAFTCTFATVDTVRCEGVRTATDDLDDEQQLCADAGGTVGTTPCSNTGALGLCVANSEQATFTQVLFPTKQVTMATGDLADCNLDGVVSADDARCVCMERGGVFTAL